MLVCRAHWSAGFDASKYYDAGHMMCLRDEDLAKLKGNIAALIDSASKQ